MVKNFDLFLDHFGIIIIIDFRQENQLLHRRLDLQMCSPQVQSNNSTDTRTIQKYKTEQQNKQYL